MEIDSLLENKNVISTLVQSLLIPLHQLINNNDVIM